MGKGCSPDDRGEVAQTHIPEGLSHWPGVSQLEKAGHGQAGLGHSVSSQPSLLPMGTWHCPHRDPSRENYLVPLSPYSYKPHFLLDLLSRSPLPPPLYSFYPHPTILMCWGMGYVVCVVAQMPTGLWPCLKSSPALPAHQFCKPAPGRQEGLSSVHAQRRVRREDRKVNSNVFLGTMRPVAEPEQGLCVSSLPASFTRPLTSGEHLTPFCSPGLFIIIPMMNANTFQLHSEVRTHHSPTLSSQLKRDIRQLFRIRVEGKRSFSPYSFARL